jgi:hypothetical protein
VGPRTGGKFLQDAPIFAAEVRSEGAYGATAARNIAAKRKAYHQRPALFPCTLVGAARRAPTPIPPPLRKVEVLPMLVRVQERSLLAIGRKKNG